MDYRKISITFTLVIALLGGGIWIFSAKKDEASVAKSPSQIAATVPSTQTGAKVDEKAIKAKVEKEIDENRKANTPEAISNIQLNVSTDSFQPQTDLQKNALASIKEKGITLESMTFGNNSVFVVGRSEWKKFKSNGLTATSILDDILSGKTEGQYSVQSKGQDVQITVKDGYITETAAKGKNSSVHINVFEFLKTL